MALDSLHYINVGPHGTFRKSGTENSSPESIAALFREFSEKDSQHLVIYFHGGLVNEESGRENADRLTGEFGKMGLTPIFFLWETGAVETLRDNLDKFFTTALAKKLLLFVLGQVTKRWGIDLAGKGPGQSLSSAELQAQLLLPQPFAAWDVPLSDRPQGAKGGTGTLDEAGLQLAKAEMWTELDEQVSQESLEIEATLPEAALSEVLNPGVRASAASAAVAGGKGLLETAALVKMLVSISVRVIKRRMDGLDHGLYPTVAEELLREIGVDEGFGRPLWQAMKDKAVDMWQPNPDVLTALNVPDAHVGTHFLQLLMQYLQAHPGASVDLVGHSAGSIVICELLKASARQYPEFKWNRIALLAPAASLELFYDELASKPERFLEFRMFAMLDKWESLDAIAGSVYPRSLLYFVSGLLEKDPATPLVGLERCSTGIKPYNAGKAVQVSNFLRAQGKDRLVLSIVGNALPGLNSNSAHHGDFDNDAATLESLKAFLKPGV